MADRARITSVEALESFHATLVVYLDKAKRSLDGVTDEVKRRRNWVQTNQHLHWKHEVRKRTRTLETKQQELFSAQIGGLHEPKQFQQQAVRKAQRALDEATEKLNQVRRWSREFDTRVGPLAHHADQLRHTLTVDMVKGAALLQQTVETLHEYSNTHPSRKATHNPVENESSPGTGA